MSPKFRAKQSSIVQHVSLVPDLFTLVPKCPALLNILCQEHIKELSAVCKVLRQQAFARTRVITIRNAKEEAFESVGRITRSAFPNLEVVFVITQDPIARDLQSRTHINY